MRFYEFASDNDVQSLIPNLKIMAAQSDDRNSSGEITFTALKNIMAKYGIPSGGDPSKVLAALKAALPGIEDLIKPVGSSGTIKLDKPNDADSESKPEAEKTTIDQMAGGNLDVTK